MTRFPSSSYQTINTLWRLVKVSNILIILINVSQSVCGLFDLHVVKILQLVLICVVTSHSVNKAFDLISIYNASSFQPYCIQDLTCRSTGLWTFGSDQNQQGGALCVTQCIWVCAGVLGCAAWCKLCRTNFYTELVCNALLDLFHRQLGWGWLSPFSLVQVDVNQITMFRVAITDSTTMLPRI